MRKQTLEPLVAADNLLRSDALFGDRRQHMLDERATFSRMDVAERLPSILSVKRCKNSNKLMLTGGLLV